MALFAPVAPASLLRAIKDTWDRNGNGEIVNGHYHLVLAHDIVENKDEWHGLLPEGSTIIIDNSVIELEGSTASLDAIIESYYFFREEGVGHKLIIVPPETLDNAYETWMDFRQAWEKLRIHKQESAEFELMYVIQGKTVGEINESFDYLNFLFNSTTPVDWVGIPRRLVDNVGTRAYAVARALQTKLTLQAIHGRDLKIHLLGFSNNIKDDIYCARLPWVHGIDSAVPLRLGQKGVLIDFQHEGDQAGPRGNYWDNPMPRGLDRQVYFNISSTRHVIRSSVAFASNYQPKLLAPKR